MKQKKISWLIASLFVLPEAQIAFAQEAQPAVSAEPVQQVTVTGIRASMRSALVAKEASNSIIEVVAAEDIGKLPDTTIAESLARLPGMSSGIDRGNASQVVARGLGPRFVGATLNGREIASSEPNRAVRFEQFPSESVTGATVYKTQSAEIVEGGIATTIDLQTVRPLSYKERQASLKVDGLWYELSRDIPGAPKVKPRLGGIYVDQNADKTLGWAIAASYQDQPSLVKRVEHWGFNDVTNSGNVDGKPGNDMTPWGFADEARRGTNKRASALGKVEWKPNRDLFITGDLYYSKADIEEPGVSHWFENLGNWGGGRSGDYRNVDVRDGYVVGATVDNQYVTANNTVWVQDMDVAAAGLNAKLNAGDWKLEADLSTSRGARDSQWRDLRLYSTIPGTLTWSMPGGGQQSYSFSQDLGNPNNFGASQMYVDTDGHMRDELSGIHVNGSRDVSFGPVNKFKIGARFTDREKKYHQTTWTLSPTTEIPKSAYERVTVDGLGSFIALKDFNGAAAAAFGGKVFSAEGRTPGANDVLARWLVKERSSSIYAQGDFEGEGLGQGGYRGNVGVRVVRTRHSGEGNASLDGGAPTPVSGGTSYTEVLPSLNLIVNLDQPGEHQLRFSVARAMSRAPLDELRASRVIWTGTGDRPLTGTAGNPDLKPMMANQLDLAYQWYFKAGSLLSAGAFYKQISRYIAITQDITTLNGRRAELTRSVNGEGGNVRGLELIYQHTFDNGFGIASNYSYTSSDIREQVPVGNPYPVEGLMKHNGGATLWYSKNGFEARLAANYHSPFVRNPTWNAGALTVNEEETWVSANVSYQLTPRIQLRAGIENLTDEKVVYTGAGIAYRQEVFNFGRRYNVGLSFKL
jgi:TonB-dependent receptor